MLRIACPAKINLFLEVVGKRPDGYHDIESVFAEIDLADALSAEEGDPGEIRLACDAPGVPPGATNLVVKAAGLLARECAVREGIRFRLEKRIPMGGGLGGGSSDAAAALRLANHLWKTGLSDAELAALAARLGSDVPFFVRGGVCLCRGRGEIMEPLPPLPAAFRAGLVLSRIHSDTAAAYRGLRLPGPEGRRGVGDFLKAMADGDPVAVAAAAFNRFEATVFQAIPELGGLHRRLAGLPGLKPRISGSGSGLWFLGDADAAAQELAADAEWDAVAKEHGVRIIGSHFTTYSRNPDPGS